MSEKRKYIRYVTKDKLDKVCEANKQHIKKFFNYKNMNLSETTKKSYESDFNQWLVFIHEKYESGAVHEEDILRMLKDEDGIEDMVDLIEDYIAFCVSVLGNNERRIQRRMSSISSFFLYLLKKRRIKSNPLDYMERVRIKKGEKLQVKQTYLTLDQVDKVRKELFKSENMQLELYFELGLSTLARVNALCNIKIEQIDFEKQRIVDVLEKEGKIVTLFPSKKSLKLAREWIEERDKKGIENKYLFVTKYKDKYKKVEKNTVQTVWIKKIGSIVDIPTLHSHDLRHSGADILHKRGVSLENVSKLLNHESTQTTLDHYLQTDFDSIQEEKEQYEI